MRYVLILVLLCGLLLMGCSLMQYSLTVSADSPETGSVTLNPTTDIYEHGDRVLITATPAEGYIFDHWSGDLSGSTNPQNIQGWRLVDIREGFPTFIFPSYTLEPDASIRVYTNEIHTESGGFSFGRGSDIWNNTSPDMAGLYDAQNNLVSYKSYEL
ncbi:MAG: lamin tail domain-containing protein [Chloroflexi bacterium]|nr:lamin tail domain-containing protein [Chloroflexota bacterium]MBT7080960.1 lamin tail domain-containing protein [Chloroflexota bacterium]MBT7290087.1 lamin tail domain-containing protein [Chloroflexota bacterium]